MDPAIRVFQLEHPLVSVLTAARREFVVNTGSWLDVEGAKVEELSEPASWMWITMRWQVFLLSRSHVSKTWYLLLPHGHSALVWHAISRKWHLERNGKLENRCSWIYV